MDRLLRHLVRGKCAFDFHHIAQAVIQRFYRIRGVDDLPDKISIYHVVNNACPVSLPHFANTRIFLVQLFSETIKLNDCCFGIWSALYTIITTSLEENTSLKPRKNVFS
jgi:hypothetical protein